MGYIEDAFKAISDVTWGWSLIPFLIVLGVFFTVMSGLVQFQFFGRMFRVLFPGSGEPQTGPVSSREALFVSIGGRAGGGNIAGVAVAITIGGPGAVFWMWMVALLGMCTSFFECTLAQAFKRVEPDGTYRGGPARYIYHGLGPRFKWLAGLFAVCLIASFGLGFNAFQGNTVAGAFQDGFGVERTHTGIILCIIAGFIVFGGIRRIAKAADIIIPIMAIGYLGMAFVVILINLPSLPGVIADIVLNAFGIREAVSGGIGAAIAQGLRRGLFSNEAGLGSAPNVAAVAEVRHPVDQGIVQSLSVFIDTMVICSATAFIILLADVYVPGKEDVDGVVLTQESLVWHFGEWAKYFLAIALFFFSFSSLIYNYYLGENAISYLRDELWVRNIFRVAIMGVVFLGAVAPGATAVFFFSDPLMGLLAIVNLLALMMLFPTGLRLLHDYRDQLAAGREHPVFNPDDFPDLDLDKRSWESVQLAKEDKSA